MAGREEVILRGLFCFVLVMLLCTGCNRDGETSWAFANDNGVSGDAEDPTFTLGGVSFGRLLPQEPPRVIHPASLVETDAITGEILKGSPRLLSPEDSLDELVYLSLDEVLTVPRNAALVLAFTQPLDPGCLCLDEEGGLTAASPIQLRTETGDSIPLHAHCRGSEAVLIPLRPLPSGPPRFDDEWKPIPHPTGFLRLHIYSAGTGPNVIRSSRSTLLSARGDLIGTPCKPIRINAGNGFLPSATTPRIIREVRAAGTAETGSDAFTIKDPTKTFVTMANNGAGEWAGAWLYLRPGAPDEEKVEVDHNAVDTIYIVGSFSKPPLPGVDEYLVTRAEYYEPIPGLADPSTAVDPVNHPKDPYDPQDEKNWDLDNFAQFFEWDEVTNEWRAVFHVPGAPVDPRWRISLRFSESMDLDSLRAYETFFVCDGRVGTDEPAFGRMKPGRVTGEDGNRLISFEPVVIDSLGADRLVGFGGLEKRLKLVLRAIPSEQDLEDFYNSLGPVGTWPEEVVEDLAETGVKGILSEGGQPLGYPAQLLEVGSEHCVIYPGTPGRGAFPPAVDFTFQFSTVPSDPKENPETGALVHRFMGAAMPAMGGTPPISGVTYFDHEGLIYGPHLYDTAIGLNGFLSGHVVEFIQTVFDDYNPPDPSSPYYPDPIVKVPFGVGTPVNCSNGVRFQHVYRNGDVSPDVSAMAGTVLDLLGAAWAPVGGFVTNTVIEKMSIAVSHSNVVPNTKQHSGIPEAKNSGLTKVFDDNVEGHNRVFVVGKENDGVPYVIDWGNLFEPKNAGPHFNTYLGWPEFDEQFPFDSAHSMLFEYRFDPNTGPSVSPMNGFFFCAGIISSMLPRFRAYSRGDELNPVYGATKAEDHPIAWGPLPSPGEYGDNSRYFTLLDYVKRVSTVISPHLGIAALTADQRIDFLTPLIDPPLSEIPSGTALGLMFQVALRPHPLVSPAAPWVDPDEVETMNVGAYAGYDFIRFRSIFEANTSTSAVPVLDTVVVPYLVIER